MYDVMFSETPLPSSVAFDRSTNRSTVTDCDITVNKRIIVTIMNVTSISNNTK